MDERQEQSRDLISDLEMIEDLKNILLSNKEIRKGMKEEIIPYVNDIVDETFGRAKNLLIGVMIGIVAGFFATLTIEIMRIIEVEPLVYFAIWVFTANFLAISVYYIFFSKRFRRAVDKDAEDRMLDMITEMVVISLLRQVDLNNKDDSNQHDR